MATKLATLISGNLAEGEEPKVLQLVGLPPSLGEASTPQERLPWPRVLVLEEEPDGYSLYRFTESGDFGGDTWHQTLEDAKHQAEFEFGERLGAWREVPEEVLDPVAFMLCHER